mgnify:CR=1 FL=1
MPSLTHRSAGILLHPTSLPGPHGTGDLGPAAHRFAERLAAAGQTWWQMLPVVPTGEGDSPYMSPSAFAGNPLLVSLHELAERGLLSADDLAAPPRMSGGRADFAAAAKFKLPRLRRAYERFGPGGNGRRDAGFEAFCAAQAGWLDDFALFCALKDARGGRTWTDWEPELRIRKAAALAKARESLAAEVRFHRFVQYQFHRQWSALRDRCRELGVGLIGDVPIFVAHDSSDVWADPEVFDLDPAGRPRTVAGVPPDYFSATGQLWGNPQYRWDRLKRRGYDWWIARLAAAAERFDAVRLDHFIGFQRFWEIPAGAPDATTGRYRPGPGADLFTAVLAAVPGLQLIAEDLGVLTPEVEALRDRFGLPGMRILQFAFGPGPEGEKARPHNFPRRCIAYTGTHDNDTSIGWLRDPSARTGPAADERTLARRYAGTTDPKRFAWDLTRVGYQSPADTVIIPVQDVLGLDTRARMNFPGTATGNWRWRLTEGQFADAHAAALRELAETYSRLPATPAPKAKPTVRRVRRRQEV